MNSNCNTTQIVPDRKRLAIIYQHPRSPVKFDAPEPDAFDRNDPEYIASVERERQRQYEERIKAGCCPICGMLLRKNKSCPLPVCEWNGTL